MMTVSKQALEANLPECLRRVEDTGEELVVTDDHVAVLKIVSLGAKAGPDEVFADVLGRAKYHGNPREPTLDEWDEA